jgi:hypothetical protein
MLDVGFIFSPITVFSVLITIGFFDILILLDEFLMLYRVIKTNNGNTDEGDDENLNNTAE